MIGLLSAFIIIGSGALAYTPRLEEVAERRIRNDWGLESTQGYDLLIAPADCKLLGRRGWLFVGDKVYTVVVVDCSQEKHRRAMIDSGILADVNRPELSHRQGWLILR